MGKGQNWWMKDEKISTFFKYLSTDKKAGDVINHKPWKIRDTELCKLEKWALYEISLPWCNSISKSKLVLIFLELYNVIMKILSDNRGFAFY